MVARLTAAGLLAVVLCAAFPSVLFGGRTLSSASWLPGVLPTGPADGAARPSGPAPVRDVEGASWVDEPAPYLVHRGLARGRVPLWNDAEGLGLPLLGNPNMGALSPLQLPVNLFPSPLVQDLVWLARAFLLGLFTLGLARELGSGWLGAFAASAALMLSGQTVEWIEHHPLNTDVFVPAALWAALALPRAGPRGVAWLALAVAAGLLGVKPQSAILAGSFGLLLLPAAWWDRSRETTTASPMSLPRRLGALFGGVALGAGLAAVALVPFSETYEQASGLVRAGRTTQSQWALPLESLSSLGGTLAVGLQHASTGGEGPGGEVPRGLPYAGLTVLLGAALGLRRTWRSWVSRALAVTVVVEVLRVHGALPVSLGAVPVLGSINYVKYCFPLYLALALLLARAVDAAPPAAAILAVGLVTTEMLWLVPRTWARRVDPYAPAPWVTELRRLVDERPGRMSGPVQLAPPLVSSAVGLRDLRSIDVLTPRDTFDFVSRLIAPSRGVTWILADPDPLLAATGPGANLADLRWIVSQSPLVAADLPAAVREATMSRRLARLFDALEEQSIESAHLSGGIHDGAGDRRFHWTCETPCRFVFRLRRIPEHFVAGLAAPEPVRLRVRLGFDGGDAPWQDVSAGRIWHDVWLEGVSAGGRPGEVVLEVDSEKPAPVFVGGVGPAPAPQAEAARERRENAFRAAALARLQLRWNDEVAHVYENVDAMGEAAFAQRAVIVPDRDAALACVAANPGEIVACVTADATPSRGRSRPEPGTAEVVLAEPERLRVATTSAGPNLLLVSRLFDPGWRATLDGSEAPLLRAGGALMALEVPPGAHEVEIEYAPVSFRIGLGLSLVSLGLLVGLLWGARPDPPSFEGLRGRG